MAADGGGVVVPPELGDTVTMTLPCGCCGGPPCGCAGYESAAELCVTVSGFPRNSAARRDRATQFFWANGRYRLRRETHDNAVSPPKPVTGCPVWATYTPDASAVAGPLPGGGGCEDYGEVRVDCCGAYLRVRVAVGPSGPPNPEPPYDRSDAGGASCSGEQGGSSRVVYSLYVPITDAAPCGSLAVEGDAAWDEAANGRTYAEAQAMEPARAGAVPPSVHVKVSLTPCATAGGVAYNAFCRDDPPAVLTPAVTAYPQYLYATYTRAPVGNLVPSADIGDTNLYPAMDGSGDGGGTTRSYRRVEPAGVPGYPAGVPGSAHGRTLRFELADDGSGCAPTYRWCGQPAWYPYSRYHLVPASTDATYTGHSPDDVFTFDPPVGDPSHEVTMEFTSRDYYPRAYCQPMSSTAVLRSVGSSAFTYGGPLGQARGDWAAPAALWVAAYDRGRTGDGCYGYRLAVTASNSEVVALSTGVAFADSTFGGGYVVTISDTAPGYGSVTNSTCPAAYAAAPAAMFGYVAPPADDTTVTPTSRHAVVTLAVGDKGRDLLAVSRPLMEAAARRWGADFHVISGEDTEFNIGEKLRLHDYLRAYDRVFYADADALIMPSAPNPFEAFPAGSAYLLDELPYHRAQGRPMGWVEDESAAIAESQGWDAPGPLTAYRNAGVMLLGREHAGAVAPPDKPYPVWHCSEQNLVNIRLARLGANVVDWGLAWNYEWWIDPTMRPANGVAHVLHFSGMDPMGHGGPDAHARRLALMRQFAAPAPRDRCASLSRPISGATARRLGLSLMRTWHHCAQGHGTAGHLTRCDIAPVCGACLDYEADASD